MFTHFVLRLFRFTDSLLQSLSHPKKTSRHFDCHYGDSPLPRYIPFLSILLRISHENPKKIRLGFFRVSISFIVYVQWTWKRFQSVCPFRRKLFLVQPESIIHQLLGKHGWRGIIVSRSFWSRKDLFLNLWKNLNIFWFTGSASFRNSVRIVVVTSICAEQKATKTFVIIITVCF